MIYECLVTVITVFKDNLAYICKIIFSIALKLSTNNTICKFKQQNSSPSAL